jgi:hypothetical protein
MSDIVTVTLNPAIDVATSVERIVDTHKLRCALPRRNPGGSGVNVARMIHRLGDDCRKCSVSTLAVFSNVASRNFRKSPGVKGPF